MMSEQAIGTMPVAAPATVTKKRPNEETKPLGWLGLISLGTSAEVQDLKEMTKDCDLTPIPKEQLASLRAAFRARNAGN